MMRDAFYYRSILVPLDGSPLAEQALPLAIQIAQQGNSKLRLALVHQIPPAPLDPGSARMFTSIELATRKSERAYLRGVQARLRERGIRLSSAVTLKGAVGPTLAQYTREIGVDLVVMATHGRGGVRRAWLGSVADHLIHHLEIPVLLVRPGEVTAAPEFKPGTRQILVPLDGSPLAEEALEPAGHLSRLWAADVTLLQVVYPVLLVTDPALPLPSAYDEELTNACREQAKDYLEGIAEGMRAKGIRASGVAVVGWNAAESILQAARPEQVSLIVLATHGRGGLRRLALGSVADKLVRAGDVPVLVCHPSGKAGTKKRSPRQTTSSRRGDARRAR